MKEKYSLEYICKRIIELEKQHNLLFIEIGNVKIWQAIRHFIFLKIAQKAGTFATAHTIKDSLFDRLKDLPSFMRSCLLYNPFINRTEREILIFDHSRKNLVDGEYIDIYTKYLIDRLRSEGASFEVYEEPHLNRHYTQKESNRKHMDFILILANLYAMFFKYRFSQSERNFILRIKKEIDQIFGINFDLLQYFSFEIQKFKALRYLLKKLFDIKNPERIFLLVGYGHTALIKAGRDKNIESIELQHGVINDYHLGYSFPHVEKGSLEYFPDKLYIWDDYWRDMCELPIPENDIEVFGFEHLNRAKEKYKNTRKIANQIIVISQGTIGPKLAYIIRENIDDLKDYTIIYKLHPGEYDRWKTYKSLVEIDKYSNIRIIDNNEIPLYKLLSDSSYLIGVYSTVVFESLHFDCKAILVDLPGIENMTKLIETGRAKLLKKSSRIIDILEN